LGIFGTLAHDIVVIWYILYQGRLGHERWSI
jgi:hypothetical protein